MIFDELSFLNVTWQTHLMDYTGDFRECSLHQEKSSFMLFQRFCPLNPQKKAVIKINKVWELYLPYPISLASRIAYGTDKTIAHTKLTISRPVEVSIYQMMWCYCHHLRTISNFARIWEMKIISITPFLIHVLANAIANNCDKYRDLVCISQ